MKKNIRLVLQILVSLGLLAFLFLRVDSAELKARLRDLNWAWVVVIFVLYSADRLLMTYKWRLLLKAKQLHAPFWELAKLYYASTFIGMFLPVTVGADVTLSFDAKSLKAVSRAGGASLPLMSSGTGQLLVEGGDSAVARWSAAADAALPGASVTFADRKLTLNVPSARQGVSLVVR